MAPQSPFLSRGFSLFGGGGSDKAADNRPQSGLMPSLKLLTDKDVYRPGDPVNVTVEIAVPSLVASREGQDNALCSFLIKRLGFEVKGMEKLDPQWYAVQKPLPGLKLKRGEHMFMDCSTQSIISNQIVPSGDTKKYMVRTLLPDIIPPSYRGATIRYLYYIRSTISGQLLIVDNGHTHTESIKDLTELEARVPLQIWVTQKNSGLHIEEGIVPATTIQMDLFWKEMDGDSDWMRINDAYDGAEEGYESSRDEILSVSSFNPMKENLHKTLSSFSLQSFAARSSNKDNAYFEGERTSISSNMAPPQVSASEVIYDSSADVLSPQISSALLSPSRHQNHMASLSVDDGEGVSSVPENAEPVA